jgi:hypothetical protein
MQAVVTAQGRLLEPQCTSLSSFPKDRLKKLLIVETISPY